MNRKSLQEHLIRLDAKAGNPLTLTKDGKKDSQTLPFFQRQVEQVMARTYEREFPELAAAMGDIIPLSSDIDEGAASFLYYLYEPTGLARFIAAYGDQTLPEVSIKAAEVIQPTRQMANQYSWTTEDIRRARFAGLGLDTRLSAAARRAHDQLLHQTILWGREDLGLPGLFTHPNITVGFAADNGSGSTFWADKTVDQIVADFATMIDGVVELTNMVERPNRVRVALAEYNLIKRRRLGAGDGNLTILQHIESIWPDVQIEPLIDLQAANSLGNLSQAAAFSYTFDAEKCDAVVPLPFTQLPVQADGLRFKVPCESKTGGVRMPTPLMCFRLDGIGPA